MASKYYFIHPHDEFCYDLLGVEQHMTDEGIETLEVYRAERMVGQGLFFCTHYRQCGESGNGTCGKVCDHYKPRNGKNGVCMHHGFCYECTDEKVTVKI